MKIDRYVWLTYDPEEGWEEYDTEKEARAALDGLLDHHQDMASECVHDEVERVALYRCERVARIRQTILAHAEDDTDDGAICRARGWDVMVALDVAEGEGPENSD